MSRLADSALIILAGGLGTRLRSVLPQGTPKPLAEVAGRPFLAWLLDRYAQAGLRHLVVSSGYGAARMQAFLRAYHRPAGVFVHQVDEAEPLGTAGALAHALPVARGDPLLAANGDTYAEVDYAALLAFHRERRAEITLALARVDDSARYGRVDTEADGAVRAFVEKGGAGGAGLINAGVYVIARRVLEALPPQRPLSLEQDVLPGYVGRGLYALPACGRFLDIGTPESYASAAAFLRDG